MQIDVGRYFHQFRVLERVAEGGMGVVYRAHDERLGRDVALKFLTRATPGSELVERLRREARSLASLNHPNIVTIHEIGDDMGIPYLVLEWIEGTQLNDPAIERPMGMDQFLPLASDIAAALRRAHQQGIIHRDLKPANVLLTDQGHAKLLDFGVAKLETVDAELTASGTTIGTVSYMSPEQARGDTVAPTSDIFSFGTLAYELLSGRLPFTAPGAGIGALMLAIIDGAHTPLRSLRPDLPVELIDLVERCLAPRPVDRFANGAELAEAILAVASGEQPAARLIAPRRARQRSEDLARGTGGSTAPQAALQQTIRFCRTDDGVRIAWSVVGSGPPLVRVLGHFTHLEMEWEWPELRLLWERLARHNTVIRYDGRGIGLSDPWHEEFTEETRQRDLDAVLRAATSGPVTLLGISEGGWTAASYANDHPSRVRSLILYGSYCRGARARPSYDVEEDEALITLIRKGWGRDTPAFRQLFTSQFFRDDADPKLLAHFNEMMRASADPDTAARYHASCHRRGDGEAMYAAVRVPTLVVHGREDRVTESVEGRLLASVIPGARLVMLPAYGHYFPVDAPGVARVAEAIGEFLHGSASE